ncbi:hypothetical protein MGG_16994 [Pyricularia oryzae 70-15]|uniref:DEAD/DEAH box helicase domain-containing protein n=1 Tax=Pyricularia oryzae (strain 70-15 / ATCC MYA-4617 / FGSC 8958) TaxID=242507 RepID=G4N3B1_PYRO7|nr:uncharacterized protein MGG_16994 [Pyricularia oryzae 70-15]EHA53456.1 hypothetical protein MGG_16994 [Pyricularia oryzae 70-15]
MALWPGREARNQSSRAAKKTSPVIMVVGTSGGKNILFIFPAAYSAEKITIIIIPLMSLRNNIKNKCDELGINFVEWASERPYK